MVSLNVLVTSIVAATVLAVFGTCLACVMVTTRMSLDRVGSAWAHAIAADVTRSIQVAFDTYEAPFRVSAQFARASSLSLPTDMARAGKNWTVPWRASLLQQFSLLDKFGLVGVVFVDLHTMFVTLSYTEPNDVMVAEWVETRDGNSSNPATVGGRRFFIKNATPTTYHAGTNFTTELEFSRLELRVQEQPLFAQLGVITANRPTTPGVFWFQTSHVWYPLANVYWVLSGGGSIKNATGHVLGHSLVSLPVNLYISRLLETAPRSANGHTFVIDGAARIVGTTHMAPAYSSTVTTNTAVPPDGCSNTFFTQPGTQPPRMGCRFSTTEFAYEPLNKLDIAFLQSPTRARAVVETDSGGRHIVESHRLTTRLGLLPLNIVAFVPETDLLGGVMAGQSKAIGAAVGVLVLGLLATVVVIHLALRQLLEVADRMVRAAELEGLDKDGPNDSDRDDDDAQVDDMDRDDVDDDVMSSAGSVHNGATAGAG